LSNNKPREDVFAPSSLPIKPTRINDSYIRGALYHYDRISEDDAKALGIANLPSQKAGSVARQDGVVVRRLQCGNLNVTIESSASILRDHGIDRFMGKLLDPRLLGDAETAPAKLLDPATNEWVPDGMVQVDLISKQITVSPEAAQALSMICERFTGNDDFEDHLKKVHPEDRVKVRAAMMRLTDWYEPVSLEYRYGAGAVRARGEIVRNAGGAPVLAQIFLSVFRWGPGKAREEIARMPGGDYELDLNTWLITLSPEAADLRRAIRGKFDPPHCFFASLRGVHQDDVGRCIDAGRRAAELGEGWDIVYRVNDTPVHSVARVLEVDQHGRPLRVAGRLKPAPLGVVVVRDFSDTTM